MKPEYTRCGALRHAMYDVDSDWQSWPGETPVTVRCERCGTERRDRVSNVDGKLMGRRYVYPEGYRYGRGERPTANEFRLQLIALRLKEAKAGKVSRPRKRGTLRVVSNSTPRSSGRTSA